MQLYHNASGAYGQWSQGCFQPSKAGPSFLARYINCITQDITLADPKCDGGRTEERRTKNHILAPSAVAAKRYKGRAGCTWIGCLPVMAATVGT